MSFNFLEHTADIKFVARGATVDRVFEECTKAVSNYITGGEKLVVEIKKVICVESKDYPGLLYNFIEELLFLLDAEQLVPLTAKVKISKFKLKAIVHCSHVNNKRLNHIKSPTFAEMYVTRKQKGWEAQAVLDV